jgi:hypothetical protein
MFTFINLRKHGRLFLPLEKRFRAVGRRWQWYWMLMVGAFAMISGFTTIDVDRYYLPQLPLVLTNFFWFLMLPTTMCIVWESVRHWGSWQERQMVDSNFFLLRQDDMRTKTELLLPLVFYFFAWINIFLVVPRSWGKFELQRDPEQAQSSARPLATDIRFKVAAFVLFCAWFTTLFSLWHSIKHYKLDNRGALNRILGWIKYIPIKFVLSLVLSLTMIGYEAACAFDFSVSPLNLDANLGMIYGLGWGPIAMIFIVYEVAGYFHPNEDRELIRQRRTRGAEVNRDIGITTKPHWWSRLHGSNQPTTVNGQIAMNVNEISGGWARTRHLERNIELGDMPRTLAQECNKPSDGVEAITAPTNSMFPDYTTQDRSKEFTGRSEPTRYGMPANVSCPSSENAVRTDASDRSGSTSTTTTLEYHPQKIRSMLDI